MRFASGVVGRAEASWVMPKAPGGLEVVGAEGTLRCDGKTLDADRLEDGQRPIEIDAADARPDRVDRLVAAARGELNPQEMADDTAAALDEVAIMSAAYRSAASGAWEKIGAKSASPHRMCGQIAVPNDNHAVKQGIGVGRAPRRL